MGSGDIIPCRRVLLVGFMGSGKTTTGRLLASRLGWAFADLDEVIEERTGKTIPELFRVQGEAAFRAVEEEVGAELLKEERIVLASGGGWPCRAGRIESAGPETLSVWLKVEADTAIRRVRHEGGGRPLLEVPDPEEAARNLMTKRAGYYGQADLHLETETRTPPELAEHILRVLRTKGISTNG